MPVLVLLANIIKKILSAEILRVDKKIEKGIIEVVISKAKKER